MPYFVYRRKSLFWDDCECHTLFIGEKAYSEMIVNAILFPQAMLRMDQRIKIKARMERVEEVIQEVIVFLFIKEATFCGWQFNFRLTQQ